MMEPGPEPVPEAEGHVIFAGDFEKTVEPGIEGILFPVVEHPGQMEGPAAGDDVGDPALPFQPVDGLHGQAGMDGHEVDALAGLAFDGLEEVFFGHVHDRAAPLDGLDGGLVDRHRPQRERGLGEDPAPDLADIPARAQVHERVGPVEEADGDLPELGGEARESPSRCRG